jgi:sulfite reductase alpha subunit-like flavoprotein
VWLFFGCRSRSQDWLYRAEMEEYLKNGALTELHTAFSRENPAKKVYVQDRIEEQGDRLCKLLLSVGGPRVVADIAGLPILMRNL